MKAKGLKAADLHRLTKIAPGAISAVINGTTPSPGLKFLSAIVTNSDIDPGFLLTGKGDPIRKQTGPSEFSNGLPCEVRDAIQKAVLMVEDFIAVVPADKYVEDRAKKAMFIMTVASLLAAGKQEDVPALMADLIRSYSGQPKKI